jgi:hypothetical protein
MFNSKSLEMMKQQLLLVLAFFFVLGSSQCKQDEEGEVGTDPMKELKGAERAILHLEYRYGFGGFVEVVYKPYLLFKDGSIYENLDTSLDKLDLAKSKQQETEHWGTWKKEGDDLVITWNQEDPEKWKKETIFEAKPAVAGEKINGKFRSLTGRGNLALGGDVLVFTTTTIAMDDNKFTFETTSGGSTSSVTSYTSEDKAGTYALDGYTITLRFNNGSVEKKFFYFFPDEKTVFGIGTRYFVKKD